MTEEEQIKKLTFDLELHDREDLIHFIYSLKNIIEKNKIAVEQYSVMNHYSSDLTSLNDFHDYLSDLGYNIDYEEIIEYFCECNYISNEDNLPHPNLIKDGLFKLWIQFYRINDGPLTPEITGCLTKKGVEVFLDEMMTEYKKGTFDFY